MKTVRRFCSLLVAIAVVNSAKLTASSGDDTKHAAAYHIIGLPQEKYKPADTITIAGKKTGYVAHVVGNGTTVVRDTYESSRVMEFPAGFYCGDGRSMKGYLPSGKDILWICDKNRNYSWYKAVSQEVINKKNDLLGSAQTYGCLSFFLTAYGVFSLRSRSGASDGVIAACAGGILGLLGLASYGEYCVWKRKRWMDTQHQDKILKEVQRLEGAERFQNYTPSTHKFEFLGTVNDSLRPNIRLEPQSEGQPITLQNVTNSGYSHYQIAYHEPESASN